MPPHTIAALPIPVSPSAITTFCQLNAICKLSLFGSVLRTDFTPESDVDVLVEFAFWREVWIGDCSFGAGALSSTGRAHHRFTNATGTEPLLSRSRVVRSDDPV